VNFEHLVWFGGDRRSCAIDFGVREEDFLLQGATFSISNPREEQRVPLYSHRAAGIRISIIRALESPQSFYFCPEWGRLKTLDSRSHRNMPVSLGMRCAPVASHRWVVLDDRGVFRTLRKDGENCCRTWCRSWNQSFWWDLEERGWQS